MAVHGIDPQHGLRLFDRLDVEIDRHRLAVRAHQHTFQHFVATRIDLLMRHVRRHIDEIAGTGLRGELQMLAPAHPRLALHHIDDALEVAVMMRAGLGVGPDRHRAGPQFLRAGAREIDRGLAVHARRRRHVGIELVAGDDANAVVLPAVVVRMRVAVIVSCHFRAFEASSVRATLPKYAAPGQRHGELFQAPHVVSVNPYRRRSFHGCNE